MQFILENNPIKALKKIQKKRKQDGDMKKKKGHGAN